MVRTTTRSLVNTVPYGESLATRVLAEQRPISYGWAVAKPRKSRAAWIEAGFEALRDGGVDAVRIERLATKLGVTKGSFYWHFNDRAALLEALIEVWESVGTYDVIDQTEVGGGDPAERLRRLWAETSSQELGAELAIRAWARSEPEVAARVQAVDNARVGYLRVLFRKIVADPEDAEARAMLMYSLLIGNVFIEARHGRRSRRRVLQRAIELLLVDASSTEPG